MPPLQNKIEFESIFFSYITEKGTVDPDVTTIVFLRCVKTEWRAVDMAFSVDLLVLTAYWWGLLTVISSYD